MSIDRSHKVTQPSRRVTSHESRVTDHGFTLLETMITVIIAGILLSFAVVSYLKTTQRAKDQEAQTILKMIRNGEQRYLVRFDLYYPSAPGSTITDINIINSALDLDVEVETRWDYTIDELGAGNDFRARATSTASNPPGRFWEMTRDTQSF